LNLKIIEPGESDYTSPTILIESSSKDPWPCIDYHKLKAVTQTEYYPLPNIEEHIETVAKAKYIILLDLSRGCWQIPLSEKAQRYATFIFDALKGDFGTVL
ncbi:Retrovirus-related Pol polyprotein from transposon 412, partial [Stegodyphus mimosarum]